MIQFAICDDDASLCTDLSARLSNYMGDTHPHHITCFASGEALLASAQPFDLIFLDIQMAQPDGMETARLLRQRDSHSLLIFVSILKEYVFDAFAVEAFDYLVKPLEQDRFLRTMDRAMQVLAQRSHQHLTIQKGHTLQLIPLSQILYCEVLGRKVHIHQEDGQVFHYYEKLEALQQQLAGHFFRCHRSYLVNLDHVRGCSGGQVRLSDGSAIPVSRLREQELIQALLHHIKERAF
ncbi:MAG: response regulator transcription factor [Ruminiclostridium sp.]|nr:response regulator transcription factor [Ruminiclostridium sp.]